MKGKRRRISSDFVLAISSLLIAFVIWLIAAEADIETDNLTVGIDVVSVPDNYRIEITPKEAIITVQYPKAQKSSIISPNFRIVLDMNNIPEITSREEEFSTSWMLNQVDVRKQNVSERVKVIEIVQPKRVSIRGKMNIEWAEVKPVIRGELKEGYKIPEPPRAQPSRVKVTGSDFVLQRLKETHNGTIVLYTEEADIRGESASLFRSVKLKVPEGLELVNPVDEFVKVIVGVAEVEEEKTITNVPIEIKTFNLNISVSYTPTTGSVVIRAPISIIKGLTENDFYCEPIQPIDETPGFIGKVAIEAKFREDVRRAIKEKVSILSVKPEAIQVEVKQKETGAETQ